MPEEENWLDGICNYKGPGYDLPVGGYCKIPNWFPEMMVRTWSVLDVMKDEGFDEKATSELKPGDIIIGATFNKNALQKIVDIYGRDFYQIRDANGDALMTLDQWQAKYGSNGLGLVAIRNIRRKLGGLQ